MIPVATKIWFTAAELADLALPGLARVKRKVNERASTECWALAVDDAGLPLARPRNARGGGMEYHISLLPTSARAALIKRGFGDNVDTEISVFPQPKSELQIQRDSMWSWYAQQSDKNRNEAERRLAVVNQTLDLVAAGLGKSAAVGAIAAMEKIGASTIYEWLKMVDGIAAGNRLPYLAPVRKGGGRKADVDPEFWQYLKSLYLTNHQPTWSKCFYKAQEFAQMNGITIPHEKTLKRKLEAEVDGRVIIAKRKGFDELRETQPHQQRSVAHMHAMEMVNIDGHKFDFFVKMPDGTIIRPMAVVIQDVFSRKILAYRMGTSECSVQTRLTFADLFQQYGIPRECLLDNGRAFASKWITGGAKTRFRFKIKDDDPTGLLPSFGIKIHWAKPYRGQSKPIERAFRDIEESMRVEPALDGAWCGNHIDAKPENYGNAAIPYAVFCKIVDQVIARHNARLGRRTETGNGKSFDQVFAESYAVSPIGKATAEHMRIALLTAEQVSANRKTGEITLAGNRYWSPEMLAFAGQKMTIRFNPDNLHSEIHVYSREGEFKATVPILEATGFNDIAAAKVRARQESDYKKATRAAIAKENILTAAQMAAMMPDYTDDAILPDAGVVRPVRPNIRNGGAAAAVRKEAPQTDHIRRLDFLRVVE